MALINNNEDKRIQLGNPNLWGTVGYVFLKPHIIDKYLQPVYADLYTTNPDQGGQLVDTVKVGDFEVQSNDSLLLDKVHDWAISTMFNGFTKDLSI